MTITFFKLYNNYFVRFYPIIYNVLVIFLKVYTADVVP